MLKKSYDYIICGAGVSGCVLARRLSDDPAVSVLLLEAGGGDEAESIRNPAAWPQNLGTERDWQFTSEAAAALDGRTLKLSMGKVLGGGSSINALQWSRGYKADWDYFAEVSGEAGWSYEQVSRLYDEIERRPGEQERDHPLAPTMWLEPASGGSSDTPLLVQAAEANGIPVFEHPNGRMLEGAGGAAVMDTIVHRGVRHSVYRGYVHAVRERANLTIATESLVTRVVIERGRAVAVEVERDGELQRVEAEVEILLCLGAVNTPKMLMLSGVGPAAELMRFGIPVRQELRGVGRNFQDHLLLFGCTWEFRQEGVEPNASRAVLQWKTDPGLAVPNVQINQSNGGTLKQEMKDRGLEPGGWWSLAPAIIQPQSRGYLELTGPGSHDAVRIVSHALDDPRDLETMLQAIALCRELGHSPALRQKIGPELLPCAWSDGEMKDFVRRRVGTFWHQSCTAAMGTGADAVVNGQLQVHGIERLRVADVSVLPRITAGNTMAPCVVIGENAARFLRRGSS